MNNYESIQEDTTKKIISYLSNNKLEIDLSNYTNVLWMTWFFLRKLSVLRIQKLAIPPKHKEDVVNSFINELVSGQLAMWTGRFRSTSNIYDAVFYKELTKNTKMLNYSKILTGSQRYLWYEKVHLKGQLKKTQITILYYGVNNQWITSGKRNVNHNKKNFVDLPINVKISTQIKLIGHFPQCCG